MPSWMGDALPIVIEYVIRGWRAKIEGTRVTYKNPSNIPSLFPILPTRLQLQASFNSLQTLPSPSLIIYLPPDHPILLYTSWLTPGANLSPTRQALP
jgi:hypothetical protein